MNYLKLGKGSVSASLGGYCAVAVILMFSVSASQSLGVTLIDDDFSDGDRFATGATDADWFEYFLAGGAGPIGGYLSVVPDATAGLGSGDALAHGPVDNAAVAMFPSVTLVDDGDYIGFSFDFRVVDGFSYNRGFRYSLFNNIGSPQTDGGTESTGQFGYGGIFGTHTALGEFWGFTGASPFSPGSPQLLTSPQPDVADALEHHLDVVLTKAGTDLEVVVNFDASEILNASFAANVGFGFNSLGLYNADAWSSPAATMYFDNVVVETSVTVATPGDVDGDALVNSVDFEIIRQNFWQGFADRTDGDLVDNDFIDFADYAQWKQAPKDPDPLSSLGSGTQTVPEPTSFLILAVGTVAAGLSRLRRTLV